jgi:signal transduction histidine kinase
MPAVPALRYVTAIVVAAIGVTISFLAWTRSLEERRIGITNVLGTLADEATGAIESRIEHEIEALRDLATFWQLHGLLNEEAWQLLTRKSIEASPGVRWIAWVSSDPAHTRAIARDTVQAVDPATLRRIRARLTEPSAEIEERWSDSAYDIEVLLPVGSPGRSVSMLAATIRVDSLWLREIAPSAHGLAIQLRSDQGQELALRRAPSNHVPPWMKLRRSFTSSSGRAVQVHLSPSREYAEQIVTPWPNYFLIAGLFLSVSIGMLLFQFLRAHDYTTALTHAFRRVDEQLGQLSRQDRQLRDLNEKLEQRVRERTAALSEAVRESATFSHAVSHDLRSPLGAILNYAVALEEDCGPRLGEEERRLIGRIRAAGQRAAMLLNGLMEFASSGESPADPQVLDMRVGAERAFAEVVANEPERDNVRFDVDRLPPAFADPLQVHRVFVNLLGNALKYSRCRAQREIQVGGAWGATHSVYWVKDNGPGFQASRASEIWKPFRRLNGNGEEGVGLGLASVARTVTGMGGRVWAESDGGSGATFYFSLPVEEPVTAVTAGERAS